MSNDWDYRSNAPRPDDMSQLDPSAPAPNIMAANAFSGAIPRGGFPAEQTVLTGSTAFIVELSAAKAAIAALTAERDHWKQQAEQREHELERYQKIEITQLQGGTVAGRALQSDRGRVI